MKVVKVTKHTVLALSGPEETPCYVVTIAGNLDAALESAEQWLGEPLDTRKIEPGPDASMWSPIRPDRDYLDGFKPDRLFDPEYEADVRIVGVERMPD